MHADRAARQQSSNVSPPAAVASTVPGAMPANRSPDAQPEAILRAIENLMRTRNAGADSRAAVRHHYCVPMTLHIDDPRSRSTRLIRAASSNISGGGFAFIFDAALTPGSTIRAQFDSLPGKPQIAGVVRSCVHICGTQHRVGVEYQQ